MKFDQLKDSALGKAEQLLRDSAYNSVIKDLKNDGIDIKDLSEDEFEQLFIEEYECQKNLSKGAGIGAGGCNKFCGATRSCFCDCFIQSI